MSDFIWHQVAPKSNQPDTATYYLLRFTLALTNWELYQKEEQIADQKGKKNPESSGFLIS
jgi:hypothetical protein